jgi:hypothetical protein
MRDWKALLLAGGVAVILAGCQQAPTKPKLATVDSVGTQLAHACETGYFVREGDRDSTCVAP